MTFVGNLVAPKLSYRMRWATRAGPVGLTIYSVSHAALHFSILQYLVPWLRHLDRSKKALTEALGREPTGEELAEHMRKRT